MGKLAEILGGSLVDKVRDLITIWKLPADQAAALESKLTEVEVEFNEKILDHDQKIIESVNATMQAESKSEHWLQWAWRPCVGFTFCAVVINNYILLPYCQQWGLQTITIPSDVWNSMLIILGVAAGTRGWEKIQRAGK